MQVVQPGLVGLMDGSVSTLAPLFAAAFATHRLALAGQLRTRPQRDVANFSGGCRIFRWSGN